MRYAIDPHPKVAKWLRTHYLHYSRGQWRIDLQDRPDLRERFERYKRQHPTQ